MLMRSLTLATHLGLATLVIFAGASVTTISRAADVRTRSVDSAGPRPEWIWFGDDRSLPQSGVLSQTVDLPDRMTTRARAAGG